MKRWLYEHSLSLVLFGLFLLVWLGGQTTTGQRVYNEEQREHGESAVGMAEYLTTGHFLEATAENWESEFLQMASFVLLTVWLRQKDSPESKSVEGEEDVDKPAPGRSWLYKNSLSVTFFVLFFVSFALHAVGGAHDFSSEQEAHGGAPVTTMEYVTTSRFWFESFQNWQSEFMAVGALVVLSVYLRQHGSPESKPVEPAAA